MKTLAELKQLREQALAAHQRAGYLYGIALAHPTEENRAALKEAKSASRKLATEYRKADTEFFEEMEARARDARDNRELMYPGVLM